jgi:hypothetical protein
LALPVKWPYQFSQKTIGVASGVSDLLVRHRNWILGGAWMAKRATDEGFAKHMRHPSPWDRILIFDCLDPNLACASNHFHRSIDFHINH